MQETTKIKYVLEQNPKQKEQQQMLHTTTSVKDTMQKFTKSENKHTQNQTQLGRELTIITENIHQEQNISNKINITQIDKGRKSLTQDKTCYGCIPQNKKLTNAQRRYIYYSSKV